MIDRRRPVNSSISTTVKLVPRCRRQHSRSANYRECRSRHAGRIRYQSITQDTAQQCPKRERRVNKPPARRYPGIGRSRRVRTTAQ